MFLLTGSPCLYENVGALQGVKSVNYFDSSRVRGGGGTWSGSNYPARKQALTAAVEPPGEQG